MTDLLDGFSPHTDAQAQRYRDAGVFLGRPLFAALDVAAERSPDAPAVTDASTDGPRTLTYAEFRAATLRRAAGFVDAGGVEKYSTEIRIDICSGITAKASQPA